MTRIAIAGGGISGLSIAWAIRQLDPSVEVTVLERGTQTGGNIRTDVADGYRCEAGPDGFLDNSPPTLDLVASLGIQDRLLPSSDSARRRFIFLGGRLHEVPTSPLAFLRSSLLSLRGKLRLACEPFGASPRDEDESIHGFASRRVGREAADVLIDSMVSGIFAGDATALSLRACFPRMWEMEREHGSLVRAMLATRKRRRRGDPVGAPTGRLTSFIGGMQELPDALTRRLGACVRTGSAVTSLARTVGGGWRVTTPGDTLMADAVVLSGPASETASLLDPLDPVLAGELNAIPTAPLAVVSLGFDAEAAGPLNGFGFLVPRSEGVRLLGALWETSIYPGRAPGGKALIRVMVGGARDPQAAEGTDDELVATVRRELRRTMQLEATPEFTRIVRHRRGIPQYVRGHLARLARIDTRLATHEGLYLAGNSYRGVSLNNCIADAPKIAATILKQAGSGGVLRRAG